MKIFRNLFVIVVFLVFLIALYVSTGAAKPLTLYVAGSLQAALGDVIASYEKGYESIVITKFGPSRILM